MRLRLVVPEHVEEPTGGNVYDLALAEALRRAGDEVAVTPCAPAELGGLLARPTPGATLVDGLLACPRPEALTGTRVGVLVHLPVALGAGLDRDLASDRASDLERRERRALHTAALVVTTSHWAARYLVGRYALQRLTVAPPGVDPAPVGTGSDPPLLVHLAALLPHKNQLGVVAALERCRDLAWRARLAGSVDRDPGYAAAVRSAVHAADLDERVQVTGVLPRAAAWAGADLALLPSLVETYGMVVTEALARGVPAVVSDTGAVEALGGDAAGGRPGVVVPPGDVDALHRELRRWLSDASHRAGLRARALTRRDTLEGWEGTARRVREAVASLGPGGSDGR